MGWCSDVFQGMNTGSNIKTPASLRTNLEIDAKAKRIKSVRDDPQCTLCQRRAHIRPCLRYRAPLLPGE